MIDPLIFIGKPLSFGGKFNIYPPTINEVLTNPEYGKYIKLLTITQEDIRDEFGKEGEVQEVPTPFEFLLINCYNSS